MTAPPFGYAPTYPSDGVKGVSGGDFSKVLLVDVSGDADADVFPFHEPIRFSSNDPAYLAKIGTGRLKAHLTGVNDQLGGKGADTCIVRVPEGTDSGNDPVNILAKTQAAIIGDSGLRTGLWAARNATRKCKAKFRLWYAGHTEEANPGGGDNPVRAALAVHLEAAGAVTVCDVDPTSKIAAITARDFLSSKRMMPMGVAAIVEEVVGGNLMRVQRPMGPRALGLIVATDNNYRKGMPFDSFANKPILGLVDTNRDVAFDLEDGSTEGQLMLASDIAVVVQGESADPGAIADGGFVFIGYETAATTSNWTQLHQVRGQDYVDTEFELLCREFLGGRYTPRRAESLFNSFRMVLDGHVGNSDIVGYKLEYPTELNSIDDVRAGEYSLRTNAEHYPIIRRVNNEIRTYPQAIAGLVAAIQANVGVATGIVSANT